MTVERTFPSPSVLHHIEIDAKSPKMEMEIKVRPKAKRNAVEVSDAGDVTVRVTAAPDDGKANDAARSLLAKRLRLPKGGVVIVRGHRSRTKLVRMSDLTRSQFMERLGGA